MLRGEVGLEDFLDAFANPQRAQRLEIGHSVQEQDPIRELVGVLHLVDQFVPLERGELLDAPIVEHAIVQPILVDRGQLGLERFVQ